MIETPGAKIRKIFENRIALRPLLRPGGSLDLRADDEREGVLLVLPPPGGEGQPHPGLDVRVGEGHRKVTHLETLFFLFDTTHKNTITCFRSTGQLLVLLVLYII